MTCFCPLFFVDFDRSWRLLFFEACRWIFFYWADHLLEKYSFFTVYFGLDDYLLCGLFFIALLWFRFLGDLFCAFFLNAKGSDLFVEKPACSRAMVAGTRWISRWADVKSTALCLKFVIPQFRVSRWNILLNRGVLNYNFPVKYFFIKGQQEIIGIYT